MVKEIHISGHFLRLIALVSAVVMIVGFRCCYWQKNLQEQILLLREKNQLLLQKKQLTLIALQKEYELIKGIHREIDPLYAIVMGVETQDGSDRPFLSKKQFNQQASFLNDVDAIQKKMSFVLNAAHNQLEILEKVPNGWPLPSSIPKRIGSAYGKRFSPFSKDFKVHTGVDLPAPPDTEIFCTDRGVVTFSGYKKSYGYTVVVDHSYGFSTLYAHCAQLLVNEGDRVKKGQLVALVGISGDTTGFHLHYEVRINQKPIDPQPFLMIDQ